MKHLKRKFPTPATLAVLIVLLAAPRHPTAADANPTNKPLCCAKELAGAPFSDRSLYQLDSTWTTDAAQSLALASLRGRPRIVTLFFTSCIYACPLLVHDLKRIEAALPEQVRTNVGFVLISFDSQRDTPPTLAAYRIRHQLPSNWTLLHGASDDILEIAALLGVKFKKDARGNFAHSNVISLLDKDGEIVTQQIGLNRDPGPMSLSVQNLFESAGE